MADDYVERLEDARARVDRLRAALHLVITAQETGQSTTPAPAATPVSGIPEMQPAIYEALSAVAPPCAEYYAQAYLDLADSTRVSWIGTVHQVRETLATLLRTLAPDDPVKAMPWFKVETKDGKPTQKQRVRYILQLRGARSTEREVAEQIDLIEERVDNVGSIVRSTYTRASTAAHTGAERREAIRILRYFEAFAHDLLDLE